MIFVVNGLLAASMVIAAMFAPNRQLARHVALCFVAKWCLYVLAWFHPLAPDVVLERLTGVETDYISWWAAENGILALWILWKAGDTEWGAALFSSLLIQATWYVLGWMGTIPFDVMAYVLNLCFLAQVAIFWVLGGPGVADHLIIRARRRWNLFRSPKTCLETAVQAERV